MTQRKKKLAVNKSTHHLLMPSQFIINIPLCLILYIANNFLYLENYLNSRTASPLKGKTYKVTYTKTLKIHVENLK